MRTNAALKYILVSTTLFAAPAFSAEPTVDVKEATQIAREAYVYGVPMVSDYATIYAFSINTKSPEYKGPFNTVLNIARVFTPEDKGFVTPNSDTPYTFMGLDLRAEPMLITVPKMEANRYFVFQLMDLYTFNFDYIGTRTTGNEGGTYMIAGPDWAGATPTGVTKVIKSETQFVNVIGRTQLFNPDDLDNVKKIQAGYKLQSLSEFEGKTRLPEPKTDWIRPIPPADQKTDPRFYEVLAFLLQFTPTHPSEVETRSRFEQLGLKAGDVFEVATLPSEMQAALKEGMKEGQKDIDDRRAKTQGDSSSLFGTREFLKNDFVARAAGTQVGIGANSREEAIYPIYEKDSHGAPLDGSKGNYTLRFKGGDFPPVNAFWSLTMYDLPGQLLVANPIKRYLINAPMLPDLKKDADGGVTIYIQNKSPGADKESNWLPAPEGPFMLAMRYYLPKPELLNGEWKSPVVNKMD
ncbi:DUF1254 domain-containing protein (plasmid) [Agrobacterium tumefaciens]|uniref:DUF1254 domain-containing protein n=1 Tax=Agrobacterium tumefaciens TaxID=358 RepID=UPI0015747D3D|nr:DUF1254 domain-containing protein [Agrobacterium tumefaciens]NSZ66949.1 DUF1254 domain-containing protein [Agrobacterium tumefaciens]NTA73147.1 DUF1254 domain-containing protein [Agrobacterium tumefaciens]WIE41683.1 DUF1254 domain-containing protein [Agrobacterium tumefaciens]